MSERHFFLRVFRRVLFRGGPAEDRVVVANFFVGTAVALLAAVLGLVMQDLLTQVGLGQVSPLRWVVLVVSLATLLAALKVATSRRTRIHTSTGTLFYVRVQADERFDWHADALEAARRGRMSVRTVTRWINDSATRTTTGIIDVSATCAEVAATLEILVNTDRDDTAYTIAPNLPWPVGLAIGAELPIVSGLGLLELQGGPPSPSPSLSPARPANPPPEISFVLARRTHRTTSDWWKTDLVRDEGALPQSSPGPARFGLLIALTPVPPGSETTPETAFAGTGVTSYFRLRPAEPTASPLTSSHLQRLAPALVDAVADVKKQAVEQGAELVVVARMPKTLAVALGWGLAQTDVAFFAGTHLMHYRTVMPHPYVPMRVHPAQPTTPPTM